MKKKDFNCSITVNMIAPEVLKKINEIPQWWGVTFTGSAEKQNNQFVVKMGSDSFFNFSVTELGDKRVVWLITDCYMPWYADKKEWANTKLIFELREHKNETTLHFTHQGLTPEFECYKDCKPGWTHWITTSLFSYLTTGKGDFKQPRN